MTPRDEKNFLVEITPEIMDELNRMYMHSDTEPIAELHYSPYWKSAHNSEEDLDGEKTG